MFRLIKKIFIGLLTGLVNGSNHTKCVSLSNQKCMVQHILINLCILICLSVFDHFGGWALKGLIILSLLTLEKFVSVKKVCDGIKHLRCRSYMA